MQKTIYICWDDEKSISKAERAKARLENSGYALIKTLTGPADTYGPYDALLVYSK